MSSTQKKKGTSASGTKQASVRYKAGDDLSIPPELILEKSKWKVMGIALPVLMIAVISISVLIWLADSWSWRIAGFSILVVLVLVFFYLKRTTTARITALGEQIIFDLSGISVNDDFWEWDRVKEEKVAPVATGGGRSLHLMFKVGTEQISFSLKQFAIGHEKATHALRVFRDRHEALKLKPALEQI